MNESNSYQYSGITDQSKDNIDKILNGFNSKTLDYNGFLVLAGNVTTNLSAFMAFDILDTLSKTRDIKAQDIVNLNKN